MTFYYVRYDDKTSSFRLFCQPHVGPGSQRRYVPAFGIARRSLTEASRLEAFQTFQLFLISHLFLTRTSLVQCFSTSALFLSGSYEVVPPPLLLFISQSWIQSAFNPLFSRLSTSFYLGAPLAALQVPDYAMSSDSSDDDRPLAKTNGHGECFPCFFLAFSRVFEAHSLEVAVACGQTRSRGLTPPHTL